MCDSVLAPKLASFQPAMVIEQNLLLKNQTQSESERSYYEIGPEKSMAVATNRLIFMQRAPFKLLWETLLLHLFLWYLNCIHTFKIFHVKTNLFPT